jgi:formamidopyrimidine-DNA glycosylase
MPELPEVETVRRGLEPVMTGRTIQSVEQRRPNLRFPLPDGFRERLSGRRIKGLTRRAKYLIFDLEGDLTLISHLGMSGSFRVELPESGSAPGAFHHPRSNLAVHDHIVFTLEKGIRVAYNDPRRFGFMELIETGTVDEHPFFRDLGIEPLGNELSGERLIELFDNKKAPLKSALLDQSLVAGLGNIYVCEALHRAQLSPRRAAGSLGRRRGTNGQSAAKLAAEIRKVLEEAIEAGGSTLRDHRLADGTLGYFQHRFRVYDREGEPCSNEDCGGSVRRIVQSGRSTFFCPICQK